MAVTAIDHAAIPIRRVEAMKSFYQALGFEWDDSGAPRLYAVKLASQKLNFHDPSLWQNPKFTLRGEDSMPGCGDFCFVWEGNQTDLLDTLHNLNLVIIEGPVPREGGAGVGSSIYVRDPDHNLIELICYS